MRPTMILTHHFFRLVLALASSAPENDHAIPRPTIARTAQSMTMLMNHLMIVASICWNPARPGVIVHLYLRFSTAIFPQLVDTVSADLLFHFVDDHSATHTQSAPGIASVTITLVVSPAAYALPPRDPKDMSTKMRERNIFFIFLECEAREIREEAECSDKDDGSDEGIDEDIFSFFHTFLISC
jgi:hypothetical protein